VQGGVIGAYQHKVKGRRALQNLYAPADARMVKTLQEGDLGRHVLVGVLVSLGVAKTFRHGLQSKRAAIRVGDRDDFPYGAGGTLAQR